MVNKHLKRRIFSASLRRILMPLIVLSLICANYIPVSASPGSSRKLFEIIDERGGGDDRYLVTEDIALAATDGTVYNFSSVNTFGSTSKYTNIDNGVVLTTLFENLGILMDGSELVKIISCDDFTQTVLWDYLTAPRWYYPNQPVTLSNGQAPPSAFDNPEPAPAIIALNDSGGRLMLGQRAPHEQTNNMLIKNMDAYGAYGKYGQIIISDGDGESFPSVTATTPASGDTVADGTAVTIDWIAEVGLSDGFVYFTTDGSEPTLSSSLYNYNTYNGAAGQVFTPTIISDDADPQTGDVTLKVKVFGKAKLPGNTAVFAYHIDGYETEITLPQPPSTGTVTETQPQGDAVVLTIIDNAVVIKEFTQSDIDKLSKTPGTDYSTYNSFPTYKTYENISGVRTADLFSAADILPSGNTLITFRASDGFNATVKGSDLSDTRYFFNAAGGRGPQVPAVISFQENGGRLFIGQLGALEQTNQAFVEKIIEIEIGGIADWWDPPTANPASGATVRKGDPIYLSLTGASEDAKIYYTLDNSEPTVSSAMYNVTAERWFTMKDMTENPPILAPGDAAFTIKAKTIGLGKGSSNTVTFEYNIADAPAGSDITNSVEPESGNEDPWVENPFSDIDPKDWFFDNVRFVYSRGLMQGVAIDEFAPDLSMSRAMIVTVLWRLAGSPAANLDPRSQKAGFSDVPESMWYSDAVTWSADNDIVGGYGNGKFGPNDDVTREQMVTILYRYAKLLGYDVNAYEDFDMEDYADAPTVSDYAVSAMQWACGAGVIAGKQGEYLDPHGNATRAEAAAVLERFIKGVE